MGSTSPLPSYPSPIGGPVTERATLTTLPQAGAVPGTLEPEKGGETIALNEISPVKIAAAFSLVKKPGSKTAEAYRLLAHRLHRRSPRPRRILVTSPRPGEGKTTCAANLAAAYGEAGGANPVLLELNVRSPALAAFLGVGEPRQSLSRYIADPGRTALELTHLSRINLYAGLLHPQDPPRRLGRAEAIHVLIERLIRAGMGPVIIDGPSTLDAVDANLLAEQCDGYLMVALQGKSHAIDVQNALAQLGRERSLGITLLER